jgi:hypothetical protein
MAHDTEPQLQRRLPAEPGGDEGRSARGRRMPVCVQNGPYAEIRRGELRRRNLEAIAARAAACAGVGVMRQPHDG